MKPLNRQIQTKIIGWIYSNKWPVRYIIYQKLRKQILHQMDYYNLGDRIFSSLQQVRNTLHE